MGATYNVELQSRVREKIGGLVAIDLVSMHPATGVWLQGQLRIRQNVPLYLTSEMRDVYAESPLNVNFGSSWSTANQPVTVQAILERYATRNETVFLEHVLP